MTHAGLLIVLLACGVMVGAAYLIAWGYKRSNARQAVLDAERIKRAGQSWSN